MDPIKNCKTCAHRDGFSFSWSKCMVSGFYCETERKHPSRCGKNFEAWTQRSSMFGNVVRFFRGVK